MEFSPHANREMQIIFLKQLPWLILILEKE